MRTTIAPRLSLRWKMVLSVVGMITIGFGVTLVTLGERAATQQRNLSIAYAEELASKTSIELAASTVQPARQAVRALGDDLTRLHDAGLLDRPTADELVLSTLLSNEGFIGAATGWEPDALDGNDAAFANTERHDETGRFIPYFIRTADGGVDSEPLVGYEEPGLGDYYIVPRRTGQSMLTEPYSYPVGGVETMITSAVVPLFEQGRFVGIAGVDIELASLQEAVSQLKVFDTGYATLVSNGGIILGDRDADQVGEPGASIGLSQRAEQAITAGERLTFTTEDPRLQGAAVTRVIVPMQTGDPDVQWALILTVPDSQMLAGLHRTQRLSALLGLMSIVVVSLGLYLLIDRMIMKPLGGEPAEAVRATTRVANGDLSQPIVVAPNDSTSVMAHLKQMQGSLSELVGSVRHSAQGVAEASSSIADGNGHLSKRTDLQTQAIQTTSESMLHVLDLVKNNASSAADANAAVNRASGVAVEGGDSMARVIDTMQDIGASSNQIVDIIEVIDNIAFQTNILALNAAVEAARAGEQGRGFAVVASEVRSLAGRSADAAKQIRQLIDENVQRVSKGTEHVDAAGANMTQVVASIEQLNNAMQTITEVSNRQNTDVSRIGESVQEFESTTRDNSALVADMSLSVSSLQSQADQLVDSVALFRL